MDTALKIRDMLRANEEEADRLERVALAYLLDSANARLRDLEERVGRLESEQKPAPSPRKTRAQN